MIDTQLFIAFVIYFILLLAIGILSHKKMVSDSSFVMGDRSLNFWLTALSAHASDMSSWLFMALPAVVYTLGFQQSWIAIGLVVGMWANWHFVAPHLRVQTEKHQSYTLSTFFERRFNDTSGVIRVVSGLLAVIFLTCYLSGGLIAMGMLFESLFKINYYVGIFISMPVVIGYIFLGGFVTVAWVDFFQGLFLALVIVFVPYIAYQSIEGWPAIQAAAESKGISLHLLPDYSPQTILTTLLLATGWGLGYYGQPHIVTKFMGIKDVKEMSKSKYLGMSWQILTLGAATAVGLIALAYFPHGSVEPELVFVEMVKSLFSPLAAGFILCAVIAANMSTMDSQILVAGSVLSEDIYKKIFNKTATPEKLLKVSRYCVLLTAVFATLLALTKSATIQDTVSYAWSGLGASFGPLVLCSLFATSVNRYGAIAGILGGGLVAGFWPILNTKLFSLTIMPIIPGFIVSLALIFAVSYMFKHDKQETHTA